MFDFAELLLYARLVDLDIVELDGGVALDHAIVRIGPVELFSDGQSDLAGSLVKAFELLRAAEVTQLSTLELLEYLERLVTGAKFVAGVQITGDARVEPEAAR